MMTRHADLLAVVVGAVMLGSAISVRIARIAAIRRSFLDLPNDRSSHVVPVPRLGGAAFVPWLLGGGAVLACGTTIPAWVTVAVLGGGLALGCLGLIDDFRPLPSMLRFFVQFLVAAGLVWAANVAQPVLSEFPGVSAWACRILLVLWVVGLVNAYNFMDGIDGLAGAQAVLAGTGWVVIGIYLQAPFTIALGGCIAASALGFLTLNWPPAKIFMGDVGSTVLGYLFAALPMVALIESRRPGQPARVLVAGVAMMWPFLADTIFTVARRLKNKENILQGHRSHIYQRLVISGLSHRTVTGIYAGLAMYGLAFARLAIGGRSDLILCLSGVSVLLFALLWGWTIARERPRNLPSRSTVP